MATTITVGYTLVRPNRYYVGSKRSIAQRVLRNEYGLVEPAPSLLIDTMSEVEAYGTKVIREHRSSEVTITLYDRDGESVEVPLSHPLVDEDSLKARRDDVRDVFLPDALTPDERREYARELASLRVELKRRGVGA